MAVLIPTSHALCAEINLDPVFPAVGELALGIGLARHHTRARRNVLSRSSLPVLGAVARHDLPLPAGATSSETFLALEQCRLDSGSGIRIRKPNAQPARGCIFWGLIAAPPAHELPWTVRQANPIAVIASTHISRWRAPCPYAHQARLRPLKPHGSRWRELQPRIRLRRDSEFDPFLLFDDFRNTVRRTTPVFRGYADRGIETITYVLRRSGGACEAWSQGLMGAGDVQWMTAGRQSCSGMPQRPYGRRMHGFHSGHLPILAQDDGAATTMTIPSTEIPEFRGT